MTSIAEVVSEELELLQELTDTEEEWALGAASFGPGGFADNMRRSYLAARSLEIRDSKAGEKCTEKFLDDASHGDKEYVQWLDDKLVERAKWLSLDAHRNLLYLKLKLIIARGYDRGRAGA